jgi:DNA (cytosine-5)-methyltransferase 1
MGEDVEKTVVELFAGVGGFRIGLNDAKLTQDGLAIEQPIFDFVWANQWEPSTKLQHAFDCYTKRFGHSIHHVNEDIAKVNKDFIPNHTLLVGGFPCQDYSVARSLSKEKGIEGKKGVLWWEIQKVISAKFPPFILLENVDRLIKSPSKQRGRDFGIMLRSLNDLGYGVEWRVINAADYGQAQRRRRIFIWGFHESTNYYKQKSKINPLEILEISGFFAKSFRCEIDQSSSSKFDISKKSYNDLVAVSDRFAGKFENAGVALNYSIFTTKTNPIKINPVPLIEIIEKQPISEKYFITDKKDKYEHLKGTKKIERTSSNGATYFYTEGAMSFPDDLRLPGRTMLTSESSVNRSTHVISDFLTGNYRTLTPLEAERLNGFPDNWTNTGMPERRRFFMMGNALVVGLIKIMRSQIIEIIQSEN